MARADFARTLRRPRSGAHIRFCETSPPFWRTKFYVSWLRQITYAVCRGFLQEGSFWKTNPIGGVFEGDKGGYYAKMNPLFALARQLPGNPTARPAVASYIGTQGIHIREIALARGGFLIIVSSRRYRKEGRQEWKRSLVQTVTWMWIARS